MVADIIDFPVKSRAVFKPRTTVRFYVGPPRQMRLPLRREVVPPEDELGARINAAKATAGFYEERLTQDKDRRLKQIHEKRAAEWNQRVLDLIAERERRTAQLELPVSAANPS